jgi:predicted  nucleic acid-binding Zn-ribbon protein
MAGLIALLRDLHRLHRQARDLRELLERLPHQLKAQRARLAKQETALKEAQDTLKQVKVRALQQESTLKSMTQQLEKYEGQLNVASSKKEYDALKTEITTTREKSRQLEDDILQALTETDERTAALPGVEKATQEAREELARFEKAAQEKQAAMTAQLAETQAQLKQAEERLSPEQREKYNRAVHGRGGDALALVRDRTCTACSTGITAQSSNELLMDRLVQCKSCGRILYVEEQEPADNA